MISIFIAGDFAPRRRISEKIKKGDYSFFKEVQQFTQRTDFSIVNLECPIETAKAEPLSKTGPNLKCPRLTLDAIKYAGFKAVTLANNHFRDYGILGCNNTLDLCREKGLQTVGGGRNLNEANQNLIISVNGENLAIINVCENEWSVANNEHGGSRPLDIINIHKDIVECKKKYDYVLVIVHGGTEHYNLPSPRMKENYRFFVDSGANAVINHHQHCYSGYEVYNGCPIFYGLGNFCFDKRKKIDDANWEEGLAVTLTFSHQTKYEIHPYTQCREDNCDVHFVEDDKSFKQRLAELNKVISNDVELNKRFIELVSSKGPTILGLLSPYTGKLLQLMQKGFLPSFVNNRRIQRLLAYIRCESHRDIVIEYLNQSIK